MSEFMIIDSKAPATIEAVVEAVTRLSTLSETEILELVSAGKLKDVFSFKPRNTQPLPPDFVDEEDLVEASALPLSRDQRRELIKSSVPKAQPLISNMEPVFHQLEPVTMSEVGAKLDLARAYMDMGDLEGARDILEDIVGDKSAWPKRKADTGTVAPRENSDASSPAQRKRARSTSE